MFYHFPGPPATATSSETPRPEGQFLATFERCDPRRAWQHACGPTFKNYPKFALRVGRFFLGVIAFFLVVTSVSAGWVPQGGFQHLFP